EDYLTRTGYRLPTDAEWEYACRGETQTPWSFGNSAALAASYASYNGAAVLPVGSLMPNHHGFFDMHGNLAEWCMDEFQPLPRTRRDRRRNRNQPQQLSVSPLDRRVVRGGSANSLAH